MQSVSLGPWSINVSVDDQCSNVNFVLGANPEFGHMNWVASRWKSCVK